MTQTLNLYTRILAIDSNFRTNNVSLARPQPKPALWGDPNSHNPQEASQEAKQLPRKSRTRFRKPSARSLPALPRMCRTTQNIELI